MNKTLVEYHAGPGKKNPDGSRKRPKPVHSFYDYQSLEQHFTEAKEIAWGGNYYIFYLNGYELTVRLDEINSVNELKLIYYVKGNEIDKKFNSFKNRQPSWTNSIESYKKGPLVEIWDQVVGLFRFTTDPNISSSAKTLAIAAIAYLFLPTDVIPDPTPLIGLIDDAALITITYAQIYNEMKKGK